MDGALPHDFPVPERPHRIYVAVTNYCTRACPWCSMYSAPGKKTFMSLDEFKGTLPAKGIFELQLEGGEPTAHPSFFEFVNLLKNEKRCSKIVISTNGTLLPREKAGLERWLDTLGKSVTIKLSVNHHLLENDPGLLLLAKLLASSIEGRHGCSLVLNVRLRKGTAGDDAEVVDAVEKAGLMPLSNVFFLQRYGRAKNQKSWDAPFLVGYNFTMVNPDGARFGQDMAARSQAMGGLP